MQMLTGAGMPVGEPSRSGFVKVGRVEIHSGECAGVLAKESRCCSACWLQPCAIFPADRWFFKRSLKSTFLRHILLSLNWQQILSFKNTTGQIKHVCWPPECILWFRKWINSILFIYKGHAWCRGASRVLQSICWSRGIISSLCCQPMHSGRKAYEYITTITLF